jgi:hypothetical protein
LDDYNYDGSLNQLTHNHRPHLLHLPAGLASALGAVVAGAASVLAGVLLVSALGASFFLANFMSVLGASALAGAAGATAAGAGVAFAGSAAIAVATDNVAIRAIANVFILSFLCVNEVDFCVYIYITRQLLIPLT